MNKPIHLRKIFFDKLKTMAMLEHNINLIATGNAKDILVEHKHESNTKLCNGLFCIVNYTNYLF